MRSLAQRLTSRKFLMALVAAVTAFAKALYPDFPGEALRTVLLACLGYVAAEAAVDAAGQVAKWVLRRVEATNGNASETREKAL